MGTKDKKSRWPLSFGSLFNREGPSMGRIEAFGEFGNAGLCFKQWNLKQSKSGNWGTAQWARLKVLMYK